MLSFSYFIFFPSRLVGFLRALFLPVSIISRMEGASTAAVGKKPQRDFAKATRMGQMRNRETLCDLQPPQKEKKKRKDEARR